MATVAIVAALSGCTTVSTVGSITTPAEEPTKAAEIEPELKNAGFEAIRATTPGQQQRLDALPPLQLSYYLDKHGVANYWMADASDCRCIFHGDEAAYQRYQDISLDNKLSERDKQRMEAEQQRQQMMMMGPPGLGSPGFGPGLGGSGVSVGFGGGGFGFSF